MRTTAIRCKTKRLYLIYFEKLIRPVNETILKNFSNCERFSHLNLINFIVKFLKFLLKNLYWKDQETLGLKINLDILYDFKNKLSLILKEDFSFNNPTLLIHGENSDYVNESDYELMNSLFKNLEIIKVPSAAHWVHADNPKFFLEKTINFLN